MGGEIPPFNPCLLIMVGSILKTIGICLTSLGSLNIQEQRNQTQTDDYSYSIVNGMENYNTYTNNVNVTDGANPYPVTSCEDYYYTYNTGYTNIKLNIIASSYVSVINGSSIYYGGTVQGKAVTYLMYLLKIENPDETINNYKIQNIDSYFNTIWEGTDIQVTMYEFTGISDETKAYFETNTQYYATSLHGAYQVGTAIYQKVIYENINLAKITQIGTYTIDTYSNIELDGIYQQLQTVINQPNYIAIIYQWNDLLYRKGTATNTPIRNEGLDIVLSQTQISNIGEITQEVIDVPGLMFEVLTMPFTFWSRALNLTLFPGTPYQLNVSMLLLSLLAIAVFVFIIRKFIGK